MIWSSLWWCDIIRIQWYIYSKWYHTVCLLADDHLGLSGISSFFYWIFLLTNIPLHVAGYPACIELYLFIGYSNIKRGDKLLKNQVAICVYEMWPKIIKNY